MCSANTHDAMVRGQRAKKDRTREQVLTTLRTIEKEISFSGFYPHNNGKLNLAEVLRRAGVGTTTLRNKHHHDIRDIVYAWIANLENGGAPTTKPGARAVATEKIVWYEEQLRLLAADALSWRKQREDLMREIQELRQQLAAISSASGKIVGIKGRSKQGD